MQKRRVKRTPRLTPMTSCAALVSAVGTLDRFTSAIVKPIAASSGPMNHGLARPVSRISAAPAPVASQASSSVPSGAGRGGQWRKATRAWRVWALSMARCTKPFASS